MQNVRFAGKNIKIIILFSKSDILLSKSDMICVKNVSKLIGLE